MIWSSSSSPASPCAQNSRTLTKTPTRSLALFGPELTSLEDGQGGPRGEVLAPAEEALAACLRIDAVVGPHGAE
eukprot:4960235-Pyramimonas_sp.AAC.1